MLRVLFGWAFVLCIGVLPPKFVLGQPIHSKIWEPHAHLKALAKNWSISVKEGRVHPNSLDVFGAHIYGTIQSPQCSIAFDQTKLKVSARYVQLIELAEKQSIQKDHIYNMLLAHEMGHCVLAKSTFASESEQLVRLWKDPWVQEAFSDIYALSQVYHMYGMDTFLKVRALQEERRTTEVVPYYQTQKALSHMGKWEQNMNQKQVCIKAWTIIGEIKKVEISATWNQSIEKGCSVL